MMSSAVARFRKCNPVQL